MAAAAAPMATSVAGLFDEDIFSPVLGELVWFIAGFAIIQSLIYFRILPQFNLLPLLSHKGSSKAAKGAGCAADGFGSKALREAPAKPSEAKVTKDDTQRVRPRPAGRQKAHSEPALTATGPARSALRPRATTGAAAARSEAQSAVAAAAAQLRHGDVAGAIARLAVLRGTGTAAAPDMQGRIAELVRLATSLGADALGRLVEGLDEVLALPTEALALALAHCAGREDVDLAHRLEDHSRRHGTRLNFSCYEALLKLYSKAADVRALTLFEDMQTHGFFASEGLCGNLLSRCGESENFLFADSIMQYLRSRSGVTLAILKTLMRVYARCGKLDLACGVYEQVLAAGFEPDEVMYGCLIKFATKCGKHQLAETLLKRSKSGGGARDFVCLIRHAGASGDAAAALRLLRQYEAGAKDSLDPSMFNCALDTLLGCGKAAEAADLFAEMNRKGLVNIVTYNTLVKGHCSKGDVKGARALFQEMSRKNIVPDAVSYNSLLDCLVSTGALADATHVLDEMEAKGVPLDRYTVSIMMKAARRSRCPRDARAALSVLDRAGAVDICGDDVAMSAVLDACLSHNNTKYLELVLSRFEASPMQPHMHTYNLLIKAAGLCGDARRCWMVWNHMVERRGLTPQQASLGCMTDALVQCGCAEDAVGLLGRWKNSVPPTGAMYTALIKGVSDAGRPERAAAIYELARQDGLKMNVVAYTALIDANAKAGKADQALRWFVMMEKDRVEPNAAAVCTLVKGFCLQGNLTEAVAIFKSMQRRGLAADTVLFNTLLDGCVRHGRYELADELVRDLRNYRLEPSPLTVAIVVRMWGRRQQLDRAFAAAAAGGLAARACHTDLQVATALIHACLQNQAPERALSVFKDRIDAALASDAAFCSMLVAGLARGGFVEQAVRAAEMALAELPAKGGPDMVLNDDCIQQLSAVVRKHGSADAAGLVQRLRAVGLELAAGDSKCAGSSCRLVTTRLRQGR